MELECYAATARVATRRLMAMYDDALAEAGIGGIQYSLLSRLAVLGSATLIELSQVMELERSTIGRNVRVLEKMGLVERTVGTDRRESVVALTDPGRRTLTVAIPLWEGAQARIEAQLGVKGAHRLRESLRQV